MALLPPSTNDQYRGSILSVGFLGLFAVMTLVTGVIHYGLPDGGAGVIAHIDLTTRRETIVAIFAWFGALQLATGIGQMAVVVRYRSLTPLFLVLAIIERGLMTIDAWFLKGAGRHHPPEHYASPVVVLVGLVFLFLSLRNKA